MNGCPARATGIDLFLDLVAAAANDGMSIFLLGARPEVVERTASELRRRHPSLRVAGVHDGYWDDDAAVVAAVRAASPDYLFLAIPSPRKEFRLRDHLAELGVPFVMGVGGSFDVVAGVTNRGPTFVQRIGMEWAWRLGQEPRRMWRRYLLGNTKFVLLVARTWLRARSVSRRAAT